MKKKVRDLTSEEAIIICNEFNWCGSCPLFATHKCVEYKDDKYEEEVLLND